LIFQKEIKTFNQAHNNLLICKCHCRKPLCNGQEMWGSNPACTRLQPIFPNKKKVYLSTRLQCYRLQYMH